MISLRTVELIIGFLTIAISYTLSTTTAGYFQAWLAKKMGDKSSEVTGFLSWNPLIHIDPIGAFCLFFLGVGWGKFIPINPAAFKSKFRMLLVFLAKPIAYVAIAFVSLLTLLPLFGLRVLNVAMGMVLSEYVSLSTLAKAYPHHSSLTLVVALILVMMIYIGVLFAVLNFILGIFRYGQQTFLAHLTYSPQGDLIIFVITFLTIVIFARPLKLLVAYGISYVAYFLASLMGII
jgi:hypothetical protein